VTSAAQKNRSDSLVVFGCRCVAVLARITPTFVIAALTAVLVPVVTIPMRKKRAIVSKHMQRVQPDLGEHQIRRAVQKSYESYARYYVETFRLPYLNSKQIESGVSIEGFEHIKSGLKLGKGVILALPHLGGWEWSGRWLIQRGHKLNAVVEKLESQQLFEMFLQLRKNYGVQVIPLDDNAGVAVQQALARNEIVALLSDRDIQGTGVDIEFFGERTTIPSGPAFFALRTGAALVPLATYFSKRLDGHITIVRPAIKVERLATLREDMQRISQDLAIELESLIRHDPAQWHLFQPNWPSDLVSDSVQKTNLNTPQTIQRLL
jgi:KDO2-lipid IV(A) lauroyltransferase